MDFPLDFPLDFLFYGSLRHPKSIPNPSQIIPNPSQIHPKSSQIHPKSIQILQTATTSAGHVGRFSFISAGLILVTVKAHEKS